MLRKDLHAQMDAGMLQIIEGVVSEECQHDQHVNGQALLSF